MFANQQELIMISTSKKYFLFYGFLLLFATNSFADLTKKEKCDFISKSLAVTSADPDKHILKTESEKASYKETYKNCMKDTEEDVNATYAITMNLLK